MIKFIEKKGIELSFFSEKDTSFMIDLKAFGDECYNKEKKDLIIENYKNIDSIACKINYNQAVIIDQDNNMRFLTDSFYLPDESKELSMVNCMEDWDMSINLKANKEYPIFLKKIYSSDLMVTEKTKKIKIIYMQKLNDNKHHKCATIIESNWINVR